MGDHAISSCYNTFKQIFIDVQLTKYIFPCENKEDCAQVIWAIKIYGARLSAMKDRGRSRLTFENTVSMVLEESRGH